MPGTVNPYAARPRSPGEAPGALVPFPPHAAYAVPDVPETTDPENTDGGFSPVLRPTGESGTLPDVIRTGLAEPPPNDPNEADYTARREANRFLRQSDEVTETSWNVQHHKVPPGQDPMWGQERPPTRPSAIRSPFGYGFSRPWHIPRNIRDAVGENAETHLSLADHRRLYEVYGMMPQGRTGVNTFRLDPTPWDRDLSAPLAQTMPEPGDGLVGVAGNRSYRLGG